MIPPATVAIHPAKVSATLNTLQMAKRVKEAGLKLLLDFHYSDYWADPGKAIQACRMARKRFS
jgi:arabinogalactan endo-1,4-beta-galactosidase